MSDLSTLRTRFFASIRLDPESACILWCKSCNEKGYGQIREGRRGSRVRKATHVSWFLKYGVWPADNLLHRCDNPPCVNPDHLLEGTLQDNVADCVAKGRHSTARLTVLERSEVLAYSDVASIKEAAAAFGISPTYLAELRRGRPRKVKTGRRVEIGGRLLTVEEIATEVGCTVATIYARLKRGDTGDRLLLGKHDGLRGL